jgi:uncharacterized protein (DUF2249 family)/iron-sulfur cluster repair protein YtfE (RIC family)
VTITETEAVEAMLTHHRSLDEHVGIRVAALSRSVATNSQYEPAVAELVAYLADEVLPHALAEEHTIYPAVGVHGDLAGTVTEMIAEHRTLASAVEGLANAPSGADAAERAEEIGRLFAAHVVKENSILLPALLADDQVDLPQLLVQMHRLTEAAQETPFVEDASVPDPEAVVLSLLLEAATNLARAGQGDLACRLVASAWAALRVPRPELAVRVTATLHRLVQLVTAEPVDFLGTLDGSAGAAQQQGTDLDLDVRSLAPAQRHQSIFASYLALAPGAGFVLVNDHDPKPLRYQFEAEHDGEFTWNYVESGPQVWRVRIGKTSPTVLSPSESAGEPELDVRVLPHGGRHESIFASYLALAPGAGFVLVNDHDPRPLRYQFEAQHDGEFTWNYVESGPQVWRVRIGKILTGTTR